MSQICYAPHAVPVAEYGPCNNLTDSVSLCCSPGQYCLTNGLCATGQGQFYSGACTDKTYKAAICPSFCMGPSKFVVQCNNSVIPDGDFCCDANGSGSCCNSANNALDLALAVTSATVSPTATPSSTATESSTPSSSSHSSPRKSALSSTASTKERTTTSAISSTGSTQVFDSTSTNSVPSSTTATLVSVSPSPTTRVSGHNRHLGLGLGIGIGVAAVVAAILLGALFIYRYWRKSHSERRQSQSEGSSGSKEGRIVDLPTDPGFKDEQIELDTNLARPVELDSAGPSRGPLAAPGLAASHENIERLSAIRTPVPWDKGHLQRLSDSPPATPTLRPNNPQGPLALPASPAVSRNTPMGSPSPSGRAIVQTDGGSTPPPTLAPANLIKPSEGPAKPVFNLAELLDNVVSSGTVPSNGDGADNGVSIDSEASDCNTQSDGIVAPPNSEATTSTLVSSSAPSTKSWDSGTRTVLDVGVSLNTAETESEQGDVSPSSANGPIDDNELRQFLNHVGWQPIFETAPTVSYIPAAGHAAPGSPEIVRVAEDAELNSPAAGEPRIKFTAADEYAAEHPGVGDHDALGLDSAIGL